MSADSGHLHCHACQLDFKSHSAHLTHVANTHPTHLDSLPVGRLGNAVFYQPTARLFHCSLCFYTSNYYPQIYDHLLASHCLSEKGREKGEMLKEGEREKGEVEEGQMLKEGEREKGEVEEGQMLKEGEREKGEVEEGRMLKEGERVKGEVEEGQMLKEGEREKGEVEEGQMLKEGERVKGEVEEGQMLKEGERVKGEVEEGQMLKEGEREKGEVEEGQMLKEGERVKGEVEEGGMLKEGEREKGEVEEGAKPDDVEDGEQKAEDEDALNSSSQTQEDEGERKDSCDVSLRRPATILKDADEDEDEAIDPTQEQQEREVLDRYSLYSGNRYVCRLCGWKSKMKGFIMSHIVRSHNVPKPFSCQHCERSYILQSQLNSHTSLWHRQGLYQCPFCLFSSDVLRGMRRHCTRCSTRLEEEGSEGAPG